MAKTIKRSIKPKRQYRKNASYGKRFVQAVRKIAMGTQETKQAVQRSQLTQIPHNGGVIHTGAPSLLIQNMMATAQGIGDQKSTIKNRVGDNVTPVGVKMLMGFSQPVDRPNVSFKLWVVKHTSSTPPAGLGMNPITGNLMLDSVDTERANVVCIKTFKQSGSNYWTGDPANSKECTFFRKLWIKLPRSQYVYNADNSDLGKDYNLSAYVGAYDAFGTLVTDIIGTVELSTVFYFKDA